MAEGGYLRAYMPQLTKLDLVRKVEEIRNDVLANAVFALCHCRRPSPSKPGDYNKDAGEYEQDPLQFLLSELGLLSD